MEQKFQDVLTAIQEYGIINNSDRPRFADKVEEMAAKGQYVYHVIDARYLLGGMDEVHMVSYCFISQDDLDYLDDFWLDLKDGYAFANVVNDTWGIEEMGSVAVEIKNGMLNRVG